MRKKICVTEEHIKNGKIGSAYFCPVSIALKDNGLEGTVGDNFYIAFAPKHELVLLPRTARRAIDRFDKTGKMKPFNFFIDV